MARPQRAPPFPSRTRPVIPPPLFLLLVLVLHAADWGCMIMVSCAPVRQPAAWGAWKAFEDEGMLAVMDRGPTTELLRSKRSNGKEQAAEGGSGSAASRWHCVAQLEQPELLLRQHEWDLNVGASVLVANTGCRWAKFPFWVLVLSLYF